MKLKYIITINLLLIITTFLTSCEGDCKEEQIEKVEWLTNYVTKTKDTLVPYVILEDSREYFDGFKEIYHKVIIKNTNDTYSNRFAVKVNYGFVNSYSWTEMKNNYSEYVSIKPNSSHTFTFYTQGGYNHNFNNSYSILQQPIQISYQERVDELKKQRITVNSCSENIEALKEKYKTIKELFLQKIENKSITNGQE
jgi:hypothetical protein